MNTEQIFFNNHKSSLTITFAGYTKGGGHYEWGGLRKSARTDILQIKDSRMVWYLKGTLYAKSITKLYSWLYDQCKDYKKIYILGASMGGFASLLFGSQLYYKGLPVEIHAFGPQVDVMIKRTLMDRDTIINNQVLPFISKEDKQYLDVSNIITSPINATIHVAGRSEIDMIHANKLKDYCSIVKYNTNIHNIAGVMKKSGMLDKLLNTLN